MNKSVVLVDACCDIPRSFLENHQIEILPNYIASIKRYYTDTKDPRESLEFYNALRKRKEKMTHTGISEEFYSSLLLDRLIHEFDSALIITSDQTFSHNYRLIKEVGILNKERITTVRKKLGLDPCFKIKLIDSNSVASGEGLLLHECIRLIKEKALALDEIPTLLKGTIKQLRTVFAIRHPDFFKNSTLLKRADSENKYFGTLDYQLTKLMGHRPVISLTEGQYQLTDKEKSFDDAVKNITAQVQQAIDGGLDKTVINISYAGHLAELRANHHISQLNQFAHEHDIRVLTSVMSISVAAHFGPQSIAISFVEEN
ncbi:DegV family protein [Gynuella sp.]|uniref:DegV family protein n=1 Tax=Gynuella sp. TaxID=2969146 RepID=UPI003D0990D7